MDVKIPTKQFERTPAWVRAFQTGEDGAKIPFRRFFREGNRILRWHEVRDRIEEYVVSHTIAELAALYERIAGEPYDGTMTKKSIAVAIIKVWFPELPDLTLAETVAWFKARIADEGEWGLGCDCGRHWAFRVTPRDIAPADPAAMTGTQAEVLDEWEVEVGAAYDEGGNKIADGTMEKRYRILHWNGEEMVATEVPVNYGYLGWMPQLDGSIEFECDVCDAPIRLIP